MRFVTSFKFWLLVPLDYTKSQIFYNYIVKKKFLIFYEYFSISLTSDPIGAKISKRYSSYKSQPKAFKHFLNFLPNGPHKITFGIFEILSYWFLFRKFQIHHCTLWRNRNPQLSGKQAIVEQNRVKLGTREQFRLYICVQLLELWPLAKFHAKIW